MEGRGCLLPPGHPRGQYFTNIERFLYIVVMARFQQNLVFTLTKNLSAFLRLDAGIGRNVPDGPGPAQQQDGRPAQRRVQELERQLEQKSEAEDRLTKQLQRERARRRRAETAPGERPVGAASGEFQQTHALPEPDPSVTRQQIFRAMASPLKPGRMLDLGGGPGNFAIPAAQMGWDVTAVDVRTVARPDAEAETNQKRANLIRTINWVESDVRDFQIERGEYDLICIFGLLHHLELDDQLELIKKCSGTLTFLACRVAPEIVVTEGPYEGYYAREPGETREERDSVASASWGNEASFQHTEDSLIRLLYDCGFKKVTCMRPPQQPNYTFYTALPIS